MNECQSTRHTGWTPVHAFTIIGLLALATLIPSLRLWPFFWLVPLLSYATLLAAIPPMRATFRPWRFGRISSSTIVATFAIAAGSCIALISFHLLGHPDVSSFRSFIPVSKLGGVLAAAVLFSVLNALFEEVIFRGILFDAVESQWGNWIAVVATAVLFGYGHLRGYPSGPLGSVLAGVYGLCLSWLRVFTGGLGLPVLAHITADATIFTLVANTGSP